MAVERVQSPFAASKRAIKRIEEDRRREKLKFDLARRRYGEERDRRRRAEIRGEVAKSEARLRELEQQQFKRDLFESILQDKPVGIFAAKKPRINKVVIHTGTGQRGRRPGQRAGLEFDPYIEESHLREMAARTNALNLLVKGDQQAEALSAAQLAPDFYPQDFFRGVGAEPQMFGQATMPDDITGGAYDPRQDILQGRVAVPPVDQLPPELDVTGEFQTPEALGPGREAPRMQHLFKMIDMMQGRKLSTTEEKVKAIREAGGGREEILRAMGALEKTPKQTAAQRDQEMIGNILRERGDKLDKRTKEILERLGPSAAAAGVAPTGRRQTTAESRELDRIRRDFIADTGLEPSRIEFANGDVIIYVGTWPNERRFVIAR